MKGIAFLSGFLGALLTSGMIVPAMAQITSELTVSGREGITAPMLPLKRQVMSGFVLVLYSRR